MTAMRAIRLPPHPQPRFTNIVGAKMGNIHAVTDRIWPVSSLAPGIRKLTAVAAAIPAAENGKKASTMLLVSHARTSPRTTDKF